MLKFYWKEVTTKDFPWKISLVLYTKKCMLHCHWCHNRKILNWWDYNTKDHNNYKRTNIVSVDNSMIKEISYQEIETEINSWMYDAIILCWWEVTIHPLNQIIETIKYIKKINNNIIIRIDTNSIFPEKMEELSNYIDCFWCDIKFPYWLYDNWQWKYDNYIEEILWLPHSIIQRLDITNKMIKWLHIANNKKDTIYRTIKYPFIKDNSFFDEISIYIEKNFQWKQYMLNDFYYL